MTNACRRKGSSLIELLVVMAIMPLPMGAARTTMSAMSRRMGAEATHPFVQR